MPKIEPNRLKNRYNESMTELQPLYGDLVIAITTALEDNTPAVAVDLAYKEVDYINKAQDIINSGSVASSVSGFWGTQYVLNKALASDYYLYTEFDNGVNLNQTMHSGESQAAVKAVLKDHFKFKGAANDLTNELKKTFDKLPVKSKQKLLSDSIDAQIELLKGTKLNTKDTQKALRKLKRSVKGLEDGGRLTKARKNLIKQIEEGSEEALSKAIDRAVNEKARYINERIARAEYARAFDMSISRAIVDDPDAIGYRWELSSGHPVPDICDVYANADAYGMGAGVYPAGAGAKLPAHPNCLCSKVIVYRHELEGKRVGRYSQERVDDYLNGLSDKRRGLIIGVGNSYFIKDYSKGLEKRGFEPQNKNIRMVSKSIINQRESV